MRGTLLTTFLSIKMKNDHRSKIFQFKQLERRSLKKSGLQRDSNPMCGFIAQLVEHRTGIAEVTGSNPVEARTLKQELFLD